MFINRPKTKAIRTFVWNICLPRVAAAVVTGAVLAAAGAVYRVFRNSLVSPDILGVSARAGLGATIGFYLGPPLEFVQGIAFASGLATVAVVYCIASRVCRHDPV